MIMVIIIEKNKYLKKSQKLIKMLLTGGAN